MRQHTAETQDPAALPFLDDVHGVEEPDQENEYASAHQKQREIHVVLLLVIPYDDADCGALTGSTSRVRPFTFFTRTCAAAGMGWPSEAAARQSSPWTNTIPKLP